MIHVEDILLVKGLMQASNLRRLFMGQELYAWLVVEVAGTFCILIYIWSKLSLEAWTPPIKEVLGLNFTPKNPNLRISYLYG